MPQRPCAKSRAVATVERARALIPSPSGSCPPGRRPAVHPLHDETRFCGGGSLADCGDTRRIRTMPGRGYRSGSLSNHELQEDEQPPEHCDGRHHQPPAGSAPCREGAVRACSAGTRRRLSCDPRCFRMVGETELADGRLAAMRIAGWVLLAVGLPPVVYGKYFFHPPYAGCGIIVGMIGATVMLWRKEERNSAGG